MKKTLTIILLSIFTFTNAQNFNYPGEISRSNEIISGNFSNKVNAKTTSLTFKATNSNEIINVLNTANLTLKYNGNNKTYITKQVDKTIKIAEILVTGKASLYKDVNSTNFIIESKKSGLKELIRYKSYVTSRDKARGILTVFFEDCPDVRSSLNGNRFTYSSIKEYTENYNQCAEYTNEYTFSGRQIKDLEFSKKKGIINVELGASYLSQQIEFVVPGTTNVPFDESLNTFSIFANVNFSPSYFNELRKKLFLDIGLGYSFQSDASINALSVDKNSILASIGPRYNFLPEAKVNPFIRTNFTFSVDSYTITENIAGSLNELGGNIDETNTDLSVSIEAGVTIQNFRFSLSFTPKYFSNLSPFEDNRLRVSNQNFGFKAAYILGKK
ncbi:hypothetical protein D7030_10200 [Flavobacteriaceae bacterium AU392]|nr:hypothetical protein D1817_06610 [Flavobacteriaceae bacterium]RKM83658.1 hypothetical protein D7030_10200 [Flavobacteriaceae bacterium AU392]